MGKFKFTYTEIEGVFIAEPAVFPDERDTSWKPTTRMTSRRKALI